MSSIWDRLEIVREVDDGEMYAWDVVALFREKENGNYWIGSDSGCSCDGPWDYLTDLSDLTRVYTIVDVMRYVSDLSTKAKTEFLSGLTLSAPEALCA